jgi:hypothetical protein
MEKTNKNPAYLLPFRSIAFLLVFVIGARLTGKGVRDISNWWSIVASAVNIVTIAILYVSAKQSGMSYRELLRLKKEKLTFGRIIGLPVLAAVIGMAGMYLAGFICYGAIMPRVTLDVIAPIPAVLAIANLIILPATVSFAEDGLYLGCGVNNISNRYAAILLPAFFYALQHCFIPTIFDARYMTYRFLSFLPLTVIFCVYYYKKRDPLPIMIGHTLLDLATGMMILSTSVIPGVYDKMSAM